VLSKYKELVGMVTSRDITTGLLVAVNKEIEQLESSTSSQSPSEGGTKTTRTFPVMRYDFEKAGLASTEIKKRLKQDHADPKLIRRAAIAAYELEMNLVVHADGGEIIAEFFPDSIRITARDSGPGIAEVDLAMQEGYSTANEWIRSLGFGAGMGLPNVKRVSDSFSITSSAETGTEVISTIHFTGTT
ncbi:MAG: ATP-binding protein, partial [Spirochaetota bacterium]